MSAPDASAEASGGRRAGASRGSTSRGSSRGASTGPRQPATGETNAWLVTGEDASLLAEAVANLVNELVGTAERSLVLEDFADEELDVGAVAGACQTPPFLADRRVVVLREAGRFTSDQLQPLIAYLEDPLPTTKLVVAGGGGTVPAKFVSAFKAVGGTALLNTDVSGREAHTWVSERIARAPLRLAPAAAALVESHLGEDLSRLNSLLSTLEAAYGTGADIGPEELEPYLGQPGSVPPWDLTDAIDKGETEVALTVLHRLMEAGSRHPLVVLAILHRHFGNILRVQSPGITSEAEAAEALGIARGRSTFPARKALDAARRLGPRGSGDAITALADAELALKGKLDWEPEVVLEVLVARLCRVSRAARGAPQPTRAPSARSGSGRPRR
jgi:DNA polymerase III subunit delta